MGRDSQSDQAERERESRLGSKNDRTEADLGDHVIQWLPNASPLDHVPAAGPLKIPLYTASDREFTTLAPPLDRLIRAQSASWGLGLSAPDSAFLIKLTSYESPCAKEGNTQASRWDWARAIATVAWAH